MNNYVYIVLLIGSLVSCSGTSRHFPRYEDFTGEKALKQVIHLDTALFRYPFRIAVKNTIKHMKIIAILSCILIYTSCLQPSNKNAGNVYKIDVNIAKETYFQSIFNSITYVQLEYADRNEISHINKILYGKNKYIINDIQTGTIFIFDQGGKYHSKIEASGNDPGEYTLVTDICVDLLTINIKVMVAMQEKNHHL